MVLDPMSAVALASSVVQFVEFASKLISQTYEYHESTDGTLVEYNQQSIIASNLSRLSAGLKNSLEPFDRSRKWSTNEMGLQKVTIECHEVANQLQKALKEFELGNGDKASFLQSFRLALTTSWGKQKMERLQRRLNEARDQVMIHLMVVVCERQTNGLSSMRDDQAQMETAILTAIQASQNDLREQLLILSKSLSRTRGPGTQTVVAEWQAHNKDGVDTVVQTLTQETKHVQRSASVHMYLDSLYFPQMDERKSQVRSAHEKTFKWVFDEQPTKLLWRDFATWLRSTDQEDSLYWVTGKPGSGKSTFMRYLLDDERTKQHLQIWAGHREVLMADCFFWNPGTKLQKSQSGLLRSLLHGLMKQSPRLIPAVSPWRWRSYDFGAINMEPWSDSELTKALHACVKAAAAESLNIFLFVDGLDEFEGSEDTRSEIVILLQQISRCENVKICVSSRPWRIYEDAFEKVSKLLLQDLTREDINLYVNNMLDESSHFQWFKRTDPATSSRLQTEVAEKSQGVFLWVFLVVRSLLQGLRDRDHVSVLLKRLEEIPSDLNAFFKQMLNQIEEAYRPQAAAMFQVAIADPEELTLMMLSFLDEQDPDFGLKMSIKAAAEPEILTRVEDTAIRLKIRCKDLLEAHKVIGRGLLTTHTVEFLHRTVRDFLQTSEVQSILSGFSRKQETDVDYYLVNAMLAQIKMLRLKGGPTSASALSMDDFVNIGALSMDDFVNLGAKLVQHIVRHFPKNGKEVRQELDKVMMEHTTTYRSVAWHAQLADDSYCMHECNAIDAFLACAAAWGMREYVVWAVGNKVHTLGRPLLSYAVAGVYCRGKYTDYPMSLTLNPELVRFLLDLGANPNEVDPRGESIAVWSSFLFQMAGRRGKWDSETGSLQAHIQTAEHLIRHGAAREIDHHGDKSQAHDLLREAFGPIEAKRLEGLWPRENLTKRPLMKKLMQSFSRAGSGKKSSRESKKIP